MPAELDNLDPAMGSADAGAPAMDPAATPELGAPEMDQNTAGGMPDGETDHEGKMAKQELSQLASYAAGLKEHLQDDEQLEAWVQAKITMAAQNIASVYHYMAYEKKIGDYSDQLKGDSTLSEGRKSMLLAMLSEAKDKVKELKKTQAAKINGKKENSMQEAKKSPKAKKDWDKDGKIESEKDEVIGSRRKAAGLDEAVEEACPHCGGTGHVQKAPVRDRAHPKTIEKAEAYASKVDAMAAAMKRKGFEPSVPPKDRAKSEEDMYEAKPSAGLSKAKKSAVVKKAKAGGDIGKPGKGFKKVAAKAAKEYGSKEKGEKVAAAAMWKNIQKEGRVAFEAAHKVDIPAAQRKAKGGDWKVTQKDIADKESDNISSKEGLAKLKAKTNMNESADLDRLKALTKRLNG
jgi:hypothetical protein